MKISRIIERFQLAAFHSPGVDLDKVEIKSVAAIDHAGEGDISFFTAMEYAPLLAKSKASAIIVREPVKYFNGIQLIHKDPKFIFAKLAVEFYRVDHGEIGIHPSAYVDPTARIGDGVTIHPRAHIESGVVIGDGVVIYPGVYVGKNCQIGENTVLHSNVVLYFGCIVGEDCLIHAGTIIGADGFGFTVSNGEICKIPQTGIVRIGNNVELGALCTIDRAAGHETVIEDNCKFDDRVHIGHNCVVGANTMISAQVGVAGTTTIGEWCLIGGQAGIADHLKLPAKTQLAARTAVITNLPSAGVYAGYPAVPLGEWKRGLVYVKRVKDLSEQIKALENRIAEMEARS